MGALGVVERVGLRTLCGVEGVLGALAGEERVLGALSGVEERGAVAILVERTLDAVKLIVYVSQGSVVLRC